MPFICELLSPHLRVNMCVLRVNYARIYTLFVNEGIVCPQKPSFSNIFGRRIDPQMKAKLAANQSKVGPQNRLLRTAAGSAPLLDQWPIEVVGEDTARISSAEFAPMLRLNIASSSPTLNAVSRPLRSDGTSLGNLRCRVSVMTAISLSASAAARTRS
jgi:hypothetical protein